MNRSMMLVALLVALACQPIVAQQSTQQEPDPVSAREQHIRDAGTEFCKYAHAVGMECPARPINPVWLARKQRPVEKVILPANTRVELRLDQNLDTRKLAVGDRIKFSVVRDVSLGGMVVIPAGAEAWGTADAGSGKQRWCRGDALDISVGGTYSLTGEMVSLRGGEAAEGESRNCENWGGLLIGYWVHGFPLLAPRGARVDASVASETSFDVDLLRTIAARMETERVLSADGMAIIHIYRSDYNDDGTQRLHADFSEIARLDPGRVVLVGTPHPELDFHEAIEKGINPNLVTGGGRQKLMLDEEPLAQLPNGHFFTIKLRPGRHAFKSGDTTLLVDLRSGAELYLRMYSHHRFLKKAVPYMEFVAQQEGYDDSFVLAPANSGEVFALRQDLPRAAETSLAASTERH